MSARTRRILPALLAAVLLGLLLQPVAAAPCCATPQATAAPADKAPDSGDRCPEPCLEHCLNALPLPPAPQATEGLPAPRAYPPPPLTQARAWEIPPEIAPPRRHG